MNILQRVPERRGSSLARRRQGKGQPGHSLPILTYFAGTRSTARKAVGAGWLLGVLWLLPGTACPAQAPSTNQNFVRKEAVFTYGAITDAEVLGLTSDQKTTTYQYTDGMVRPLQSVAVQANPTKQDVVQAAYYDARGLPSHRYLPYRATTTNGAFQGQALTDQAAFYNTNYDPLESAPYAKTTFENSPLARPLNATEAGSAYASKYTNTRLKVDPGNTIRRWTLASGLPQSTGLYPAGALTYQETTDPQSNVARIYSDPTGKTVLKQVRVATDDWLSTYYVYNDYDELLYVIPPQAAGNLTPTQAFADTWYYCYEYDNRGRTTGTKAPSAGWAYTIYDQWDRPVLTQNFVQRSKSPQEWWFTKYDAFNRPAVSGLFTSTSTRSSLTTAVSGAAGRFETRNTTDLGYTLNGSYPTGVTSANVRTLSYYDDYSYLSNAGWDPSARSFGYVPETGYSNVFLTAPKGLVTGSKSRVSASGVWFHEVTYYNAEYHPVLTVFSHNRGGTGRTNRAYNFAGEITKTLTAYTYTGGSIRIGRQFSYDHAGRPRKVFHKINDEIEVEISSTDYDKLGRYSGTYYHKRAGSTGSYLYNVIPKFTGQGRLSKLDYSRNTPAGPVDLFEQELYYDQATNTGNVRRYDGLIAGSYWKHGHSPQASTYHYSYDGAGRLTGADFLQKDVSTTNPYAANDFYGEDISYSDNGNISSLTRKSERSGTAAVIDQLGYTYNGNRLLSVGDAAPTTHKASGFKDGNTVGDDYEYDGNGNLTRDKNKGISITYNELDLPERTTLPDGSYLIYYYNAGGTLLSTFYYNSSGAETRRVQRVGELEFESGQLTTVYHEAGRALVTTSPANYQYYLTDHLGSTRVVMQERAPTTTVTATMEESQAGAESEQFMYYGEASRVAAGLLNHTPGGESRYAVRLSGGGREQSGLARSVSVMPGDTVRMEVFGKYLEVGGQPASPSLLALLSGLPPAGAALAEAGAAAAAGSGGTPLTALLTGKGRDGKAPPAYLNYLFFDQDKKYKYGGFVQLSQKAREDGTGVAHEKLSREVVVEEPGYLYVYLSNESETPSEVYFDDFTVSVSESRIVQLLDYYPYGMVANSWVRSGEKETRDLFQGKPYEEVLALSHFGARQYDASLGRWQGVDPANQFASPYTGMGNNPVMGVDPDGRAIPFLAIVAIGAAVGGGVNVWQNAKHINNAGDFFKFFGWGAAVGAGSVVAGAAFAPVIGTGAIAGAAIGSVSGATLTAGNIALGGGNGEKAGKQILSAFVWGGIGGGAISGTLAAIGGRNFFTGMDKSLGPGLGIPGIDRPSWSLPDVEDVTSKHFWRYGHNPRVLWGDLKFEGVTTNPLKPITDIYPGTSVMKGNWASNNLEDQISAAAQRFGIIGGRANLSFRARGTLESAYREMKAGTFNPANSSDPVKGFQYEGKYYLFDGHHRMHSALRYYVETGNSKYVDLILETGRWLREPPITVYPFPVRFP